MNPGGTLNSGMHSQSATIATSRVVGILENRNTGKLEILSRWSKWYTSILRNHPVLSRDLQGESHALDHGTASDGEWSEWWLRWPLERWQQPIGGVRWFVIEDGRFRFNAKVPERLRRTFEDMSAEIVDYRLAYYARSRRIDGVSMGFDVSPFVFRCRVLHSNHVPILRLDRSKIPKISTEHPELRARFAPQRTIA